MPESGGQVMLKDDPNYRRVKLRSGGLFSSSTYWLGPDHLLIVVMDGYRENYRRIYYRDVQSVVLRETRGATWLAIVLLLLLVVGGGLPLLAGDAVGIGIGITNLVLWLPLLTYNFLMGPTCGCKLTTAVQSRDLPALGRWRQAERLLAELLPAIDQAQGRSAPAPAPGPDVEAAVTEELPPAKPGESATS